MKMIIEIPDNKVPFMMDLFSQNNFKKDWQSFTKSLPQGKFDITIDEIDAEIKAVRKQKLIF